MPWVDMSTDVRSDGDATTPLSAHVAFVHAEIEGVPCGISAAGFPTEIELCCRGLR